MKWCWLLLMLSIMLLSSSVCAETVKLCSSDRTGLSEKDGTGYYWDVLSAVYKIEGLQLIHTSAPFIRCLKMIEQNKVDGAVAVFQTPQRSKKFTYPQIRLGYSSYGLTSLKETAFAQIENVQGEVGLIRGYDFSAWLPSHLTIHPVGSLTQAIQMLKFKRIPYHAGDLVDVFLTMKKMGEQPKDYTQRAMYSKSLYVPFSKDARGQKLANLFSSGMSKIYQNGTLERLMSKHKISNSILGDFK